MIRMWSIRLLALLLFPTLALAQNTGKLSGRVVDASTGEPLPGANVFLEGTTLGTSTDVNGGYTIFEIPPGTYTVVASFVGYVTVRQENVQIIAGITTRLDFELRPAAIEGEEVVVVAARPLVNPTATNAVRRLDREEFEKLPTRAVSTYYAIQPGVTLLNGEVYIRGGRPDETEYLLEGISSRSLIGTDNVIPVIPEALEEIQVFAGGYSAELGGANAGIVQQVLRTGGPQLSGMVQYESDFVADAFNNTYSYGYNDLTFTLGGPLVWNQHRFFVALNYRTTDDYNPMFWYGANLDYRENGGLCVNDPEQRCIPPIDDVRGDTAVASLRWEDGKLPGIGRPLEELRLNGTLLFDFNPLRIRFGGALLTANRRINTLPTRNFYNQERIPRRDDLRWLASMQATYFLSSNTYLEGTLGLFQYNFEVYDPLFDPPKADGQGGAVLNVVNYYNREAVREALSDKPDLADLYTRFWQGQYQQPPLYRFHTFRFHRPGRVLTAYQRREQSYWNVSLGLVSQQENHELRLGGHYQRWTVREYVLSGSGLASILQNDPSYIDQIKAEAPEVAFRIRQDGWGGYGYDEFMNKVDSGLDGPKHPVTASLYINDKIEFNDIIVNAGLRWDYFDMDLWTVDDLSNPAYDPNNATVLGADEAPNGLKAAPAKSVLQPRLGLSFPVTDRTVFHLQYGKFAQMPDMGFAYTRRSRMALIFSGRFFFASPFAFELEPIKTTQYEIGFSHQFTDFSAFDITAFYRKTEGQLEIIRVDTDPTSPANPYNLFTNGDFSIARGIEISLRTRRVGGVMAMFNYTLTDAKGTNSEPGGQVSALENGTAPPSLLQPLEFEQRHRGSIVLDYRTGAEQPMALQNLSVNLLFSFNSGHRFTRSTGGVGQRGADEGALLTDSDPRNRVPLEPLNSSTTPWYFRTDLRIEKGFSFGRATATAYMYIENLLNRRNPINVYLRTGNPFDDGFLSNPELSEEIVRGQGPDYVYYYQQINLRNRQHYIADEGVDLFDRPRQVRLGLRVEF
ncbi:MAG: TonB-dependent receptor [Rhodothermus sp.]|nr:TonB-dependent receptor [Rhodothermus sp.]